MNEDTLKRLQTTGSNYMTLDSKNVRRLQGRKESGGLVGGRQKMFSRILCWWPLRCYGSRVYITRDRL